MSWRKSKAEKQIANPADACVKRGKCDDKGVMLKVEEYFVKEKPFLDPNLTLDQVAQALYTNRVYVSAAINQCTQYNFCQYVNLYRVRYAIELFLSDKTLRVQELASRSGFNSTRTFSLAFRLYMNMNPGEWCRANREHSENIRREVEFGSEA